MVQTTVMAIIHNLIREHISEYFKIYLLYPKANFTLTLLWGNKTPINVELQLFY